MTHAAVLVAGGYLALLGVKAGGAWWQVRRERRSVGAAAEPSVTILQPILSGDPGLAMVLADNLRALPRARVVWLVDDDDGDAQALAGSFVGAPNLQVLSCPRAPDGVNPKTFKLDRALAVVNSECVVVLDDDARLSAASLAALLGALAAADLATALPFYRDGDTWPARLLGQFVNDSAALTYLPLLPLAAPVTINGMCYGLRVATLRGVGGFAPLLGQLTDDLAMADLVRRHGGRIAQLAAPVEMQTAVPTGARYVRQMHRWFLFATLLLRRQSRVMAALIVGLHGLHPLGLWALSAMALWRPGLTAWLALGGVLAVRAAALVALQTWLTGASRHRPLLSIASELLQPLHLLHASLRRTITWRTRRYRVFDNDRFVVLR